MDVAISAKGHGQNSKPTHDVNVKTLRRLSTNHKQSMDNYTDEINKRGIDIGKKPST